MKAKPSGPTEREQERDYVEHQRAERIRTGKLACWLVILLMPFGVTLDFLVYPERLTVFLALRIICSAIIVGVYLLHNAPIARQRYPLVGMPIVLLPAFFIGLMIFLTDGGVSSYYAGLNLILLAVSAVGHWTLKESLAAVVAVFLIYLGFTVPGSDWSAFPEFLHNAAHAVISMEKPPASGFGEFFGNVYFLLLTGVIVVWGNTEYTRLRREAFLEQQGRAMAEKLSSLGEMSAVLLHEVNNWVNIANTGLFALSKKSKYVSADQRASHEATVDALQKTVLRVSNLVSSMDWLTKNDALQLEPVRLASIVQTARTFFKDGRLDRIQINESLPTEQRVLGHEVLLGHVVANLLKNACDALQTKSFNGPSPAIWIEGRQSEDRIELAIRDNGPGISPEHQARIFQPFFTTKSSGGMGMGLSFCDNVMKRCNGSIQFRTEPGQFCEFILNFPAPAPATSG